APNYKQAWQAMMQQKLGLNTFDEGLVEQLMHNLEQMETDMTIFFRKLADIQASDSPKQCLNKVRDAFYATGDLKDKVADVWASWFESYVQHIKKDDNNTRKTSMNQTNPKYVLRNYLAQLVIDKANTGDLSMLHELFEVLKKPYDEQPEHEAKYAQKRPDWAKEKAGCSMLSCSS
ncbi:MAG: protein adenylyltransferase SelO family protein, partial [Ghiorsea sp.]|nr:protein adenylyltransferase SelO family protein [Ghiorsea sp.]